MWQHETKIYENFELFTIRCVAFDLLFQIGIGSKELIRLCGLGSARDFQSSPIFAAHLSNGTIWLAPMFWIRWDWNVPAVLLCWTGPHATETEHINAHRDEIVFDTHVYHFWYTCCTMMLSRAMRCYLLISLCSNVKHKLIFCCQKILHLLHLWYTCMALPKESRLGDNCFAKATNAYLKAAWSSISDKILSSRETENSVFRKFLVGGKMM